VPFRLGRKPRAPAACPRQSSTAGQAELNMAGLVMRAWWLLPQNGVDGLGGFLKWEFQGRGLQRDWEGWG